MLLKYGSDGTEPYTTTTANPTWAPLASDRRVYVEYSNEVWNYAYGFNQTQLNQNLAASEVAAGGSNLNFDGDTNQYDWAQRRAARRGKEVSDIFRGVFGDADMMTRVRPVLMSQLSNAAAVLYQRLIMLEDFFNNPDRVAAPQPPNHYFYGAGGSAYYSPDLQSDTLTSDSIFQSVAFQTSNWTPDLQKDVELTLPFGLKRIAYEGGPGLDQTGHGEAIKEGAWLDPRMRALVVQHHAAWKAEAGDLLVYYSLTHDEPGYYQWGFARDVLDLNTPKMLALSDILAASATTSTVGTAVPGVLVGSTLVAPPYGGSSTLTGRSWAGYTFSVTSSQELGVSLALGGGASGKVEIWCDGRLLGSVDTASNASTPAVKTGSLTVGSHGLLLRATGGNVPVQQITIQ